jgi:RNA polymerase-associated protein
MIVIVKISCMPMHQSRAEQRQYIWRFEQDWFKLADIMLKHADTLILHKKPKHKKNLKILYFTYSIISTFSLFMSENFRILDCMLAPIFHA